jgi:phage tail sheath protein FI
VRVVVAKGVQLILRAAYADPQLQALLHVQAALLRMCAARGDLLAVLALPEHFRAEDAQAYLDISKHASPTHSLRRKLAPSGCDPFRADPADDAQALNYGAVYHPWLVGREESRPNALRRTPPDGAACGVLAQRALQRGAWIAPANEPLHNVVAVLPDVPREHWLVLQDLQLNLVRQEARGFLVLNEDTLSCDPDLRPINVRRLLTLLRRLALREGTAWVFEPNSDAFQRLVQRSFEAVMEQLFKRGAFAGHTAATAYQVVTDQSLNTQQSMDQGRFIVELKVAPSQPLRFLSVRLVQSNEGAFVSEGAR